jgi:hypothetical protein
VKSARWRLRRPAQPRRARSAKDDAIGRHEPKLTTHFHDLPPTFVHEAVVEVAEQKQIGKVAGTTSRPSNYVVGSRPADRAITPGETATMISSS